MTGSGTADHNAILRAMLIMGCSVSLFPCTDAISKYLVRDYDVIQVTWARYLFHFLLLAVALGGFRALRWYRTRRLPLLVLRSALSVVATLVFIVAIKSIPIVDGYTILFTNPLLIVALSVPLLGERVGIHRWTAVIVGFTGILFVLRPGSDLLQLSALLALVAALCVALSNIITRIVSRTDHVLTTLLYMATVGTAMLTLLVPFHWRTPSWDAWALMALSGLLGGVGHFGVIKAIQMAPVSALAPLSYVQIISATALGYFVFGTLPDAWTLAGLTVIVGSGLYVFHRERRVARASV
ncbi:MAG: DMT family transporter [Alphaproteobacteria bacterium]|nr:DMT family transporter [Alphaproteobacteria bacterium]